MRLAKLSSTIIVAASVAACAADSSTGPGSTTPVTVAFMATGSSAISASLAPSGAPASTSSVDNLVITKAQLVLSRIELQKAGAVCTSAEAAGDDDADDDREHNRGANDCAELELAPSLVDLPVNGTVVDKLTLAVPTGTYSALEAKIAPLSTNGSSSGRGNGKGSTAFLTAHPDFDGVSIRVEGTFNGKAFTFKSPVRIELEKTFDPPLEVGTTPPIITIDADLATWFKTSSGTLIDPATANGSGPNAAIVAQNIRRSFKAFRDDDRNGHDDHDDERGGNSGHH